MDFSMINYLSVLVAAVATFVLGALWYSPLLFSKAWLKEVGFDAETMPKPNMLKTFGGSFVMFLVMDFTLAIIIQAGGKEICWSGGMITGLVLGLGFIGTATAVNYIYQRKSFRLWLIDAMYQTIGLGVAGVILAVS
mgnify:CR=1 FL=1